MLKNALQSVKKGVKQAVTTVKNKLSRESGRRISKELGGRGVKAHYNRKYLDELKKKGVSRKDALAIKRNNMNADIGNHRIKADVRDKTLRIGSSINRHKGKLAIVGAVGAGAAYNKKKKEDATLKGKLKRTVKSINNTTTSISKKTAKIKKRVSSIGANRDYR